MSKSKLIEKLTALVVPLVEESDCELYYIEYVKEAGENYLRIYIDKEEGISLDDCEKVNRKVSSMLDVEDPIEDSYYLEVSSPGIFRTLFTEKHLERYIGYEILVKLYAQFENKKKYEGSLIKFDSETLTVLSEGAEVSIPREKIANISLNGEL